MRYIQGRLSQLPKEYPAISMEVALMSRDIIVRVFKNNYTLLKMIDKTVKQQTKELNELYGLKINQTTLSSYKCGFRFRCGWLLVMTLKHYWLRRGYDLPLE